MDSFDLETMKKINPSAIKGDGALKSFKEQLFDYEHHGFFNPTSPFIVVANSSIFRDTGAGKVQNAPITINKKTVDKVRRAKHDLSFCELADIDFAIQHKNVLMMDSKTNPGDIVMVIDTRDDGRDNLIVAFAVDATVHRVDVHRISSIYEKEKLENFIKSTWENGLTLYPQQNTESWIKTSGLQLPQELSNFLKADYTAVSKDKQLTRGNSPVNPCKAHDFNTVATPQNDANLSRKSASARSCTHPQKSAERGFRR